MKNSMKNSMENSMKNSTKTVCIGVVAEQGVVAWAVCYEVMGEDGETYVYQRSGQLGLREGDKHLPSKSKTREIIKVSVQRRLRLVVNVHKPSWDKPHTAEGQMQATADALASREVFRALHSQIL